MSDELAKTVMLRVNDRLERGEAPPSLDLPASKEEFPKLLCLDTLHWIGLGQAHYGRDQKPPGSDAALEAIRLAISKGRLVVPVVGSNFGEAAAAPMDDGQRIRLARFMVDLSRNFSCLNPVTIRGYESDKAIERHLRRTDTLPSIRTFLVRWGMHAVVAGRDLGIKHDNPGMEILVNQVQLEPEMSVTALVTLLDKPSIEAMRQREIAGLEVIDAVRKNDGHLSPDGRRPAEMLNVLMAPSYLANIVNALHVWGIPMSAFEELLTDPQRRVRFARDMPQLDIKSSLVFERDRNPQKKSEPNDFRDMEFLEQAIAYGNIVLTEKLWTSIANDSGLAKKHGTVVLKQLAQLPEVLASEGCL